MNLPQSARRSVPRAVRAVVRLELAVVFASTALLGCHETPTSPIGHQAVSGPKLAGTTTVGSFTAARDLGTLGGLWSDAHGINASGDIVGVSADSSGASRATLWPADGSAPRDLGRLSDSWGAAAMGINAVGDVVGWSYTSGGQQHAVLWPVGGGAPRDLGGLPGASSSSARAINDAGDVVGSSYVGTVNPIEHATLWPASGGLPRDLGTGRANAINSAGTIVGYGSPVVPTVWPAGGGAASTLPGWASGWAFGINGAGDVVGGGWSGATSGATLWPAGGGSPRNLPGGGTAYAINDGGDIVGIIYLENGESRAALWPADGSGPQDLGILAATDWSSASGINSSRRIVGVSQSPDLGAQPRAVVWEPVVQQPQSITFTSSPPTGSVVGGTYTVSATGGGSGNAVTFSSLTPTVCPVAGNSVSLDAGGTCTIAADQAASAGYLAAPQVTQSFDVNTRPVANAGAAQSGNEGSTITFGAGNSSDADGDALIAYTWDFGDGTVQTVSSPTVAHIYSDNKPGGGAYVIALQVTDARGATSAAANTLALIANIAPVATFDPASPVGEGTINLSLTGAQDAPGDVATLQYALDCGNGTGYGAFSGSSSIACVVPDNGVRAVRAKIKDKDGAVTEYTRSVTVVNVAPTIAITSAPASGKSGVDYTLAFSFTDPGTADAPWLYQIIWGDGKHDAAPKSVSVQGATITESYRYNKVGSYSITMRVTDKDGAVTTSSVQIVIVK